MVKMSKLNGWYSSSACKARYKDDSLHNEDGPAWISLDGTENYFLNGLRYSNPKSELEWALTVKRWKEENVLSKENS